MVTVIRERYELLETLGAGGEARVVKALDRQHDRFVALKIRAVRDETAREELLNEARILLAVPPHPALPLVREDFFDGEDYVVAMDWSTARISRSCCASGAGRAWRRGACSRTSPMPRRP
jgi:serine/threonine protein kinase